MANEVVDHSNDHFNGDRPACEKPEICDVCGGEMGYSPFVSMGPGYSEWESYSDGEMVPFCSVCKNTCVCGSGASHSHDGKLCCGGIMCCPVANE